MRGRGIILNSTINSTNQLLIHYIMRHFRVSLIFNQVESRVHKLVTVLIHSIIKIIRTTQSLYGH